METLFSTRKWWDYSSTTYGAYTIQYEHKRSGADMQYRFKWKFWLTPSGAYFYNAIKMPIYLNGTNVATIQIKTYKDTKSIDIEPIKTPTIIKIFFFIKL